MTRRPERSHGVLISVHTHHLVSAYWVHPDEVQLATEPAKKTKGETELVYSEVRVTDGRYFSLTMLNDSVQADPRNGCNQQSSRLKNSVVGKTLTNRVKVK